MDIHTVGGKVRHILKNAAAVLAELHNRADIVGGRIDMRIRHRLLTVINTRGVWVMGGIVDFNAFAIRHVDSIDDARDRGHQIEIVFALQPLLDDLQMQKAQKAAPKAEAQCAGGFRLIGEGGVIELQLFQCVAQILIVRTVRRVHAAENHGIYFAVSG